MSLSMKAPEQTVFVIEDDPMVRDAMTELLAAAGHAVEPYADAETFLAAYSPRRPGCVVSDLSLPDIDGLALQQRLAAVGEPLPIIFVTGRGCVAASVQALKAGAVDFLEKPVAGETLLARVGEALRLDRERREVRAERRRFEAQLGRLTQRELQILQLIVKGFTSKEIARLLEISHRTVDVHRARVMHKMGARSVQELVATAVANRFFVPA